MALQASFRLARRLRRPGQALFLHRRELASAPGVVTLKPPLYRQVPIQSEQAEEVLKELPDLILSGSNTVHDSDGSLSPFLGRSLLEPFDQEVLPPTRASSSTAAPDAHFAELANGMRVVTVDRQGMCASIGLFLQVGSRYETAATAGLPHALELIAFRSSAHLSHLRTLKTLEQLGATASCRVGREDLLYQVDVLREYVPVVLPLMLANVLCPLVLPEEVRQAHEYVKEVQRNLEENVESHVCELLNVAAYGGNTLGLPLYLEEKDLGLFTAENIQSFIKREATPERMILVGVNVGFDELCKWTARCFAELDAGKGSSGLGVAQRPESHAARVRPMQPATYTGGELRIARPNPLCHLMLGWEVAGGWNGPMLAAATVLQMLLGGGGSFSTGGPGKGMHTRLYTQVLNRHHWVESVQASTVMYADSGLFTIYATIVPQYPSDFLSVLEGIFKDLKAIPEVELQRAKNALKSSIHMNLEMRGVMMEDIGRQLVLSGKVGTAQQFGLMIDAVTPEDLQTTLRNSLRTAPTLVAYGAIEKAPTLEAVRQRLSGCL